MLLDTAESETLSMYGNFKRENREILLVFHLVCDPVITRWNGRKTSQTVQPT
jgi:hypothetical protein